MVASKHNTLNYQYIKLFRECIGVLNIRVVYSFRLASEIVAVDFVIRIN